MIVCCVLPPEKPIANRFYSAAVHDYLQIHSAGSRGNRLGLCGGIL